RTLTSYRQLLPSNLAKVTLTVSLGPSTSRPMMSSPQPAISDGETKTCASTSEALLTTAKSRGSEKAGMAHRAASRAIAAGRAKKRRIGWKAPERSRRASKRPILEHDRQHQKKPELPGRGAAPVVV